MTKPSRSCVALFLLSETGKRAPVFLLKLSKKRRKLNMDYERFKEGFQDALTHVCSVQIWKEAFDHFEREPKKFETNEICSIMDTQITGWKRAGVHRFSKEGYGRQRSWVREGTEESGNEPDKDGFTKLTEAEQLELPFDLPDREKGWFWHRKVTNLL